MKKLLKTIEFCILLSLTSILLSCATAITTARNVVKYNFSSVQEKARMDFIGFKIDNSILSTSPTTYADPIKARQVITVMSPFDQAKAISSSSALSSLGTTLSNNNIAENKADTYFGIYSLQEMELYKTDNRYVTFVEVAQNRFSYDSNESKQFIWGTFGGSLAGGGLTFLMLGNTYSNNEDENVKNVAETYQTMGGVFLGAGLLSLIPCLMPVKTTITFTGTYNVYIYDTLKKAIVRKEPVSLTFNETFEGSYDYDNRSKDIVHEFIAQQVSYSLLRKYDEINKWILTQE